MPSIPMDHIHQFVTGPVIAQEVNAAFMVFKKALIQCALGTGLSHHRAARLGRPA